MQVNQEQPTKKKLYRNIAMTFRVTPEEREMILRRQRETGIRNMRAYLLKMAVNGRVINVELDSVREMNRLLGNVSNNINQISRRVNETGNIYMIDIEDLKAYLDKIGKQQKEILRRLCNVLEVI